MIHSLAVGRSAVSKMKFQVVIEKDEDGVYVAEIHGVCACYAQGRTAEEAMANIKDVLGMCIEEMSCRGEDPCPKCEIVGVEQIEVEL
jgi:predicted RNase H-like HicB family nuclease